MAPDLGPDVRATLVEATVGLVVGGGRGRRVRGPHRACGRSPRRAVYPLLVVSQTVPVVVLAPLSSCGSASGCWPKVVVVALIGFFPIVVSTVDGLLAADPGTIDLVRSIGGGRLQRLRLVQVPSALPVFFAGLKIAATYAVVGAVIGEWMGDVSGLGLVMTRAPSRRSGSHRVFVAVVVVALVSLVLFAVVSVARAARRRRGASARPVPDGDR